MKIIVTLCFLIGFGITSTFGISQSTLRLIDQKSSLNLKKTFKEKPLIINFWATWCGNCLEEMNFLNQELKALNKDVTVLSISIDSSQKFNHAKLLMKQYKLPFILVNDSNKEIYKRFASPPVPFTLIQYKDVTLYQSSGFNQATKEKIKNVLQNL